MRITIKNILRKILLRILQEDEPHHFYTKDWLNGRGFEIGDFTYGNPKILHWGENASLKIGKFCSIADEVTILLGGNHRVDWISTFPFSFLEKEFPLAKHIDGHPAEPNDRFGRTEWCRQDDALQSDRQVLRSR